MIPEIELDILHFLDRAALERLQMHSRYLRDVVSRHARTLPLRRIDRVVIIHGEVYIVPLGDQPEQEITAHDENRLEALFHRVNNVFIRSLQLSFHQQSLPLLYHLRGKANVLQCQIGGLRFDNTSEEIDYALVDFMGVHLKPWVYEASIGREFREDYVMLYTQNALRGTVNHLVYDLHGPPAPVCIVAQLLGVDDIDTCAITTDVDPRPWIVRFIEAFEMVERGAQVVESVSLIHERFDQSSPLSHAIDPLGHPRRTDAPIPQSEFIEDWILQWGRYDGTTVNESTVAKLFVFANAKAGKKLEVFEWTIELSGEMTAFNYAFFLQVTDV